ncbi:MAG: beta strand repeat-containing protein, partial [Cetobacterium sp.]
VGPIQNTSKATDRNGVEKVSTISTASAAPALKLTKVPSKATYSPGESISYTVTVENTGTGIAANYLVEDLLQSITGGVANNGTTSALDISGSQLLSSWNINAALAGGSTKSLSTIITNGGTTSNTNLLDIVTIFPNEKIVYTINTTTKDSAISTIANTGNIRKVGTAQNVSTSTATTTPIALANNGTVIITKVPTQIEYKPGDVITYTLTVTNPNNAFMNNVAINDLINSIKATQIDGTLGSAFDSWDLSVLSASGTGTVPGTGIITNASGDLSIIADIGPGGSIVYQIQAKTKLTTVGLIVDDKPLVGDNVLETGPGVKMSTPILEIAKNVNSTEYVPGGTLTYTINVDNPGDGYATNVLVTDKLSAITTQLIDGSTGSAYQSWTITSKIYDISTATPTLVTSPSDPTSAGTYSPTADLNVTNAVLGPNRRITYTVVATLNPKAKGSIKNLAAVNGAVYSDKGSLTKSSKISIGKSTPTAVYSAGDTTTIEYDVVVSNSATAGVALGVKVEDKISAATAALLGSGASTNAFTSWTIDKPILVGPETKTTLTGPITTDLIDTVDISPGGSVTYKVRATLKTSTASAVLYGPITNTASADTLEASATTAPKFPNLVTSKAAISGTFNPGDTVSFKVTVTNSGAGYANDALIKDSLNTTYFENIVINGTPTGLGTSTGITNPINTDLNATVDIAPGGKVEYTVVAKVKAGYTGNTVSNTVEVKDTQNNLTTTTSATITKGDGSGNLIDFNKRSNTNTFAPDGTITYFID